MFELELKKLLPKKIQCDFIQPKKLLNNKIILAARNSLPEKILHFAVQSPRVKLEKKKIIRS